MREQIKVVVATVVVFVSGLLIGVWTQRSQAVPPPIPLMGEFGAGVAGRVAGAGPVTVIAPPPPPGAGGFFIASSRPPLLPPTISFPVRSPMSPDVARQTLQTMMPEFRAFQDKIASIEDQFRDSLKKILRPDQQKKLAELSESPMSPGGPFPGCLEPGPFFTTMVIYRPLLENLIAQLNLDVNQQAQVKQLLIDRRNRLLALVDETPPPSLLTGKFLYRSTGAAFANP